MKCAFGEESGSEMMQVFKGHSTQPKLEEKLDKIY